jgi:hypothetical protein
VHKDNHPKRQTNHGMTYLFEMDHLIDSDDVEMCQAQDRVHLTCYALQSAVLIVNDSFDGHHDSAAFGCAQVHFTKCADTQEGPQLDIVVIPVRLGYHAPHVFTRRRGGW